MLPKSLPPEPPVLGGDRVPAAIDDIHLHVGVAPYAVQPLREDMEEAVLRNRTPHHFFDFDPLANRAVVEVDVRVPDSMRRAPPPRDDEPASDPVAPGRRSRRDETAEGGRPARLAGTMPALQLINYVIPELRDEPQPLLAPQPLADRIRAIEEAIRVHHDRVDADALERVDEVVADRRR